MCLNRAFDDTGWLSIFLLCSGSSTVHCAANKHFLFTFPFLFMAQQQEQKKEKESPKQQQHFQIQTLPSILKLHNFAKKCAVAQMLSPDFFLKVRCAMTCLITTNRELHSFLLSKNQGNCSAHLIFPPKSRHFSEHKQKSIFFALILYFHSGKLLFFLLQNNNDSF